jgi:Glycosyl hydrolase family 63 C-terminal domain
LVGEHRLFQTAEGARLREIDDGVPWRRWGPYLSERQWGTVREDYSHDGNAWTFFPHAHALSRAYRWGEDGLAGFCDTGMRWCLGLALWNGKDPFLKERLFGLSNGEGNHGEDVKEVYHYADALPSHAYNRMVYRYPQRAFPYAELVARNAERGRHEPEFELADTGIFEGDAYFDVTVEYAKAAPDDVLMQISVRNASASPATLHVVPQVWGRNTWSWSLDPNAERAWIDRTRDGSLLMMRRGLKPRRLSIEGGPDRLWLFTENDTNAPRLFGTEAPGPFKDGIDAFVVHGWGGAQSRRPHGSKAAAPQRLDLPGHGTATVRLRLRLAEDEAPPFADFDRVMAARRAEADEFYAVLHEGIVDPAARAVQRQAFAGLLWSKQVYIFDVPVWLAGDPGNPAPPIGRRRGRNKEWSHLNNADVILMPDKWEYPWYAAWDLAFHCVAMARIDPGFAKDQLILLNRAWYMHPNGQLPAYEWEFSDVNPPVQAWAAFRVYQIDRELTGAADTAFLERILHKLLINFTWWVNRKDSDGRNIFQGGFLGLDNIGPFNRSEPAPDGGIIDQADGTAWMAMYALNLLRIALELALVNPVYQDIATKFFEHFLTIASAMAHAGEDDVALWDEADGFYYDTLRLPDGSHVPLRLRSMVGLIPIFAVEVLDESVFEKLPDFTKRLRWFLENRPKMAALVSRWNERGMGERHLLSVLRGHRLKRLLRRMLDESEFLSDYGVRSLSKAHAASPYRIDRNGAVYEVEYTPGESTSGLFGGNSNWRGPVWMPLNYLLIDALRKYHSYYGPEFKVACPSGSETMLNLAEVADELSRRLSRLFLPGAEGVAPSLVRAARAGGTVPGHLLFHEFFHGDTGEGLGSSHQTGWTALVADLVQLTQGTSRGEATSPDV